MSVLPPIIRTSSYRRIVAVMVVFSSIVALLTTALVMNSAEAGTSRWKSVKKTTVVGFFAQDLASTDETTFDYIASNFGLLDKFQVQGIDERDLGLELGSREEATLEERGDKGGHDDKKGAPWEKFEKTIKTLNKKAPRNTAYKVLYLARHGQGYHNVAESFYGTHLWDCYWSLLDGNGTARWDDAELTEIGIEEAQKAKIAFKDQIRDHLPLPDAYYSSPLSRAATTIQITWEDITLSGRRAPRPVFKDGFRETIGIHTCDRRNTKTWLSKKYPNFDFERGFTEEDKVWDPVWREPNQVRNMRLSKALDEIFAEEDNTYISITAHSGAITSILEVIGHRSFRLQTGGVIPTVVKVEYVPKDEPSPTSVEPSYTAPVCTANPTAASS